MTLLTFQKNASATRDARETDRVAPPADVGHRGPHSLTTADLAHLLFDQQDRGRVHEPWRGLIATAAFSRRHDLAPIERTELSYDRLRLVNEVAESPESLASDPARLAALHEWTGFVDSGLCTLSSIHYNLFLGSILDHDGYGRNLSDFTSLRRTGTFLCTELAHGNDAAALETTATFDPATGGFVLHTPTPGAQKFMPNTSLTGGPKSAVVAARLLVEDEDQGVFLFLTPLGDERGHLPGVKVRALPERAGSPVDHCLTSFDHVRLDREALLEAEHGQLTPDGRLNSNLGNRRKRFLRSIGRVTTGKLCMSAAAIGASRTALAIAVRHAHLRHISGPRAGERIPLAAHRSHHGRLLHALAQTYAMTFLHREAVTRWTEHTDADGADVERLVAIAKGWITWQARDVMTECRERCGAQGLFSVNRLAGLQADNEGTITAEGDNLVIWVKAAAEMILGHRTDTGEDDRLPCAEGELSDTGFLRDLLAAAESLWRVRARTALREGPSGNPVARWNGASEAALTMVAAHAEIRAADALRAAAERAADPTARFLLDSLCRLFLLRRIREHTGDLLAEGHLTARHVRELPQATDAVIAALAPHMTTLVDAFDIPAEVLSAIPLANGSSIVDQAPLTPALAG